MVIFEYNHVGSISATTKKVNFAFMERRSKQSKEKGEAFERLARAASFKWAQLARELDVAPQTITHWRHRGVAVAYAVRVADLLGCEPEEISTIAPSVAEIASPDRLLTPDQRLAQQKLFAIWNAQKRELNLTPEKAAHEMGMRSMGEVLAYLKGRIPLNPDVISKFARLLQVSPGEVPLEEDNTGQVREGGGSYIGEELEARLALPGYARQLIALIEEKALDGSLTKEHTAVLKSSLELMTGHGKK